MEKHEEITARELLAKGAFWKCGIFAFRMEFVFDEAIRTVKAGDIIKIPAGKKHRLRARSELEFIEVQLGSQLVEEDIVRKLS